MRAFIAIEIPFEEKFREYQEKIKESGGFSFPKAFHLTLKFLGEVSEEKIERIKSKLKEVKFKPINVSLGKLGVFPSEKRINIIWIDLKPAGRVIELQEKVEKVLEGIVEREKREFKVHVTLARVKFVRDKEKLLEGLKDKIEGEFAIDRFKLIKSELTPERAVYTMLGEYDGKKV